MGSIEGISPLSTANEGLSYPILHVPKHPHNSGLEVFDLHDEKRTLKLSATDTERLVGWVDRCESFELPKRVHPDVTDHPTFNLT